jgi:hypothetical protein
MLWDDAIAVNVSSRPLKGFGTRLTIPISSFRQESLDRSLCAEAADAQ